MRLRLVELETAKLAHEIGFDVEVEDYYAIANYDDLFQKNDVFLNNDVGCYTNWNSGKYDDLCTHYSAPTQELLRKWIRDTYDIEIVITPMGSSHKNNKIYEVFIHDYCNSKNYIDKVGEPISSLQRIKLYEDALEAGLKETLRLLINGDIVC